MTNNSPPNSFFSLVLDNKGDKESTAKPGSEEEFSENRMVKEETQDSQVSENTMGLGESTSRSSEDEALATSVMQTDSVVHSETMSHDARRVLVHLMRQGSVMASQKSKLFELLCRHESAIRKHLSEVYLRLVLDQKMGVAFVASADYQNDIGDINVEPGYEGR